MNVTHGILPSEEDQINSICELIILTEPTVKVSKSDETCVSKNEPQLVFSRAVCGPSN